MNDLVTAVVIFVLILALMLLLRLKIGENFEVKNSDILIAIVPVVL